MSIDPRAAERIARECRRNLSPAGAFWGRQAELALLNHLWSEAKLPDAGQLVVSRVTGSMLDAAQSWPED